MPHPKYRELTQYGRYDTRVFKQMLRARNKWLVQELRVPDAVKAAGIAIEDATATFPPLYPSKLIDVPVRGLIRRRYEAQRRKELLATHLPKIEDHPLYKSTACVLFDGSEAMSDGVDQACVLTHAVARTEFPDDVFHKGAQFADDIPESAVVDSILHAERYDPTLEKLPRRFDPVLFWVPHQRAWGTPVVRRNNILLNNLFRHVQLAAIPKGLLENLRIDRDGPVSGITPMTAEHWKGRPFVLRFQPHLIIQSPNQSKCWADKAAVDSASVESLVDVHPIDPIIDLGSDHVYNDEALLPRPNARLNALAVCWSRDTAQEMDQKYPWTTEQNAANAVLHTFGFAVAEASKRASDVETVEKSLHERPLLAKGVQLVNGRMDLVAFQLNTLNLRADNTRKNIVWLEKGAPLYTPKPFYEQLEEVKDLEFDTFRKFAALLIS